MYPVTDAPEVNLVFYYFGTQFSFLKIEWFNKNVILERKSRS